ncbi:MAG: sulfite exporter TauE/SafE family protein [Oscillospiraceae bacterium]|nr:sulfite exporter TauE/SafE family protein [Oscillospiraceae bacterium]
MNHLAGFLAGATASMGLGGGFILIIYLSFFENISQSQAGGINLLFFLPIALVAALMHFKNGLIEKKLLPIIAAAGVAGAIGGSLLMYVLDEGLLRKLFAGLLLIVGAKELFGKSAHKKSADNNQGNKPLTDST